jgi:hypothetical protein
MAPGTLGRRLFPSLQEARGEGKLPFLILAREIFETF